MTAGRWTAAGQGQGGRTKSREEASKPERPSPDPGRNLVERARAKNILSMWVGHLNFPSLALSQICLASAIVFR